MPVTLARVLIFVFGLSYGCGLIRSLILRQRRGAGRQALFSGRSKPSMPRVPSDSAVAADKSERMVAPGA